MFFLSEYDDWDFVFRTITVKIDWIGNLFQAIFNFSCSYLSKDQTCVFSDFSDVVQQCCDRFEFFSH